MVVAWWRKNLVLHDDSRFHVARLDLHRWWNWAADPAELVNKSYQQSKWGTITHVAAEPWNCCNSHPCQPIINACMPAAALDNPLSMSLWLGDRYAIYATKHNTPSVVQSTICKKWRHDAPIAYVVNAALFLAPHMDVPMIKQRDSAKFLLSPYRV